MTWPLALGLTRDIPWDLGDSLLNAWILGWDADHLWRFVTGDVGALREYWQANIFHPEPLALAYSEHLTAQAIQILPVYAATKNLALSYNLLFLSTFVLSGLGVFLLVRELTGSTRAAFVAGLLYAFAPYRIGQFSHVQILSSQWMPFALFGLRRFFTTRRAAPLVGATAAIVLQNLSCGYFLVYFAPFVACYAVYEIVERKLVRDLSLWGALLIAAIVTAVLTWPFLSPYLRLREAGFPARPLGEVEHYSADVYSYLTAHGAEHVWGSWVRAFPKPEGELFPGLVPVVLAAVGLAFHAAELRRRAREVVSAPSTPRQARGALSLSKGIASSQHPPPSGPSTVHRQRPAPSSASSQHPPASVPSTVQRQFPVLSSVISRLAFGVMVLYLVLAAITLTTGGFAVTVWGIPIRAVNLSRSLRVSAIAWLILLALSRRARLVAAGLPRSVFGFYLVATIAAFWLSLGPSLKVFGTPTVGDGLYSFFYRYVPGFDGVRVPARYGMLVVLFLSVVAGYGAAAVERRWSSGRRWILAAGLLFLVEATSAPIFLNGTGEVTDVKPPNGGILTGSRIPPVYPFLATLPPNAAIVELPFGESQYELRYMVYSSRHWRPLLNGYSGGFPPSYMRLRATLSTVVTEPERAWRALMESTATHAVVHEDIYLGSDGATVSAWLERHGARELARFGSDRVFELR